MGVARELAAGQAEANLLALIESIQDPIWSVDVNYGLLTFNRAFQDDFEHRFHVQVKVGMRPEDLLPAERAALWPALYERALSEGAFHVEYCQLDGRTLDMAFNRIVQNGETTGISVFGKDISDSKRAAATIHEASEAVAMAEEDYQLLFNSGPDAIFVHRVGADSLPGLILAVNDNACRYLGYTRGELLRMRVVDIAPAESHLAVSAVTQRILAEGQLVWEGTHIAKDGRRIPVEINTQVLDLKGLPTLFSSVRDVSQRKDAETARVILEEQLRQAQKLESVGRLAGGIAHDFNNILTVIIGYSDILVNELKDAELKDADRLRSHAMEISKAGERAASLTKQLLAFSRKQVSQSRIMDLNTTIRESAPMLERLIGEDIALATNLDSSLGAVMADPDELHQVIMNLAVNARDAMADGGRIDIATINIDLNAEQIAAIHPNAIAGRYVLMSVTDTGHGIDEAIRQHMFEPFFTTKDAGKGTGLGLSTVHGIIYRGGGWIDVSSEPGVGTSFKVYLPRRDEHPVPAQDSTGTRSVGGRETILLVEDQEAVRSFTKAALQRYGYHIIEASCGEMAIAIAKDYSGKIHLLLTDVVLPGMSGRQLSERLAFRPNVKVLFTSGYTDKVIAWLDQGIAYIQKPFTADQLAAKVREVLGKTELSIATVLLAEDSKEVRKILAETLCEGGYAVVEASDGMQALQRMEDRPIQVVLMDSNMPRMGGIAAAREIRRRRPEVKIVLMSAAFGDVHLDPQELGVDAILAKPLLPKALLEAVRQLAGLPIR